MGQYWFQSEDESPKNVRLRYPKAEDDYLDLVKTSLVTKRSRILVVQHYLRRNCTSSSNTYSRFWLRDNPSLFGSLVFLL